MKPQKRIGYLLTIATIVFLSCDISTLAIPQQIPPSGPGAIGTIVVQTAAAAATQTVAVNPPSALGVVNTIVAQTAAAAATRTAALIPATLTPSFTPFPTKTASITPTNTATFIVPSRTSTPKPTSTKIPPTTNSGGGGGGGGPAPTTSWSCNLVSQNPVNATHFAPGTGFNANWTVTNTSDVAWMHTTVDIIFSNGTNLSSPGPVVRYDTHVDTNVGSNYLVTVPMAVPALAGTYSMTWSLQAGATIFCPMSLSIIVP